tara:strand:- start:1490 stop:1672 length:183 start_codon:yes stop_codon:yes gene_type:complete
MRWFVCKTVKEYHFFSIEADTEEEAWDKADEYICLSACADEIDTEVEYVRRYKFVKGGDE